MSLNKIINNPISSNCFVVTSSVSNKCIIVDPGTKDNWELLRLLKKNNLHPELVILTHEHFDHCIGVNMLTEIYSIKLICSQVASSRIANSKTNFSSYYDEVESFEIKHPIEVIKDESSYIFEENIIHFYETPGHSPGSMCFRIGCSFFTGDTLLNNMKIPLKLPGSNKEKHKISVEKLENIIIPGMIIYPGHGESFTINTCNQLINK